jgi:hypothetical protein
MKTDNKDLKNDEILRILADSVSSLSLRALHQRITRFYDIKIAYRTLQRKVQKMLKMGELELVVSSTHKYSIKTGVGFVVNLTHEELTYLVVVLPDGPLSRRLKAEMGI